MKYLIGLILVMLPWSVSAQQKSAYDRYRNSINAQYDRHRQMKNDEYERFRDSCNAAYAEFLKKAWSQFEGHEALKAPEEEMHLPKEVLEQMRHPEEMVVAKTAEQAEETAFNVRGAVTAVRDFFKRLQPPKPMVKERSSSWTRKRQKEEARTKQPRAELNLVQQESVEQPVLQEQSQQMEEERTLENETDVNLMSFDFYGTEMQVDMGNLRDILNLEKAVPNAVSEAWTLCSKTRYLSLIQDCLSLKREYHLGDWAYLQMLKTMANKAFGSNSNESTFLTAYIYCQSGYRIRLGQYGDELIMLYTTHHKIYGYPYWQIDNQDFYSLNSTQTFSTIHACDKAINAQEQPLSLWMKEPIKLDDKDSKKRLIQSDKYPEMKMEVAVNENLIRYCSSYPNSQLGSDVLTRWAIYADTPLNEEVKEQIYPTLKVQLQGLPEDEQICRLLSLIQPRDEEFGTNPQNSLIYGYDDKEWGYDRAFFAEETLHYPRSDCEDHAILFSRLVRDLLGLKVLLVYYKAPESVAGHLATAVHFNKQPSMGHGDALIYNGERYYVCDPTNWDPRPGVTMAGMNNAAAQVILLN